MNLVKQFLNQDINEYHRIKTNNNNITLLHFSMESDILKVTFVHDKEIEIRNKKCSQCIMTSFYFHLSTNFLDIFDELTLEDINNYDIIKNLHEQNKEKIFLNHIENMKNYDFCDTFIKQFDSEFLNSIQNYTLPDIVKINIIFYLSSSISIESFYWNKLQIISFLIIKNKFSIVQFADIEENNTLKIIFKYNLAENIIKFDNFTSFLNYLDEDITFVILKESNKNFFELDNENIKYKFLISNSSQFQFKDNPSIYSAALQHYFISQLLNDNNRILESISDSKDTICISHTFLSTVVFLNNLQHYIDTADSLHQFYKLVELFNKHKNSYLIFNDLEHIKSRAHNLVYLLYQNNLIDYDQLDNNLKLNVETIISEKQLQYF